MPNRDEILRELKVEEIQHPQAEPALPENILVKFGKLRYNQSNTFDNPQDIPDLGYVMAEIAAAIAAIPPPPSGGVDTLMFNENDLTDAGGGNWYLQLTLSAMELVLAMSTDITGQKEQNGLTVQGDRIYGFPSNDPQNIIVKIG